VTTTVSIRVDDETSRKLAVLAQRAGNRNAAVVAAIDAAFRELRLSELRRESSALAADPDYQAEVESARADMGAGDAW
jgi:predicted transcriptional regulator